MKVNKKKINKAILEIQQLQIKYCKVDTMFICHALHSASGKIGWDYASLLKQSEK